MSDKPFKVNAEIGKTGLKGKPPEPSTGQIKLCALMVRSLEALHQDHWGLRRGLLVMLVAILFGAVLGGLGVTALGWGVNHFNWPAWVVYTLGLIPIIATVIFVYSIKFGWWDRIFWINEEHPPNLLFHQMELAIGNGWAGCSMILGFVIGIHIQLLHITPNHCGLTITGEWWQCALIAINNLAYGVPGSGDLYEFSLGDRVAHSRTSTTIFWLFRTACVTLVLILGVALYNRGKIVHLGSAFNKRFGSPLPKDPLDAWQEIKRLREYLRDVCYRSKSWAKSYHDEFVFFCLVEKYLSNKYPECRALAKLFPEVSIPSEVRALFRDPDGELLIPLSTDSE